MYIYIYLPHTSPYYFWGHRSWLFPPCPAASPSNWSFTKGSWPSASGIGPLRVSRMKVKPLVPLGIQTWMILNGLAKHSFSVFSPFLAWQWSTSIFLARNCVPASNFKVRHHTPHINPNQLNQQSTSLFSWIRKAQQHLPCCYRRGPKIPTLARLPWCLPWSIRRFDFNPRLWETIAVSKKGNHGDLVINQAFEWQIASWWCLWV